MKRAYSPKEIAAKKWVTLPWGEAVQVRAGAVPELRGGREPEFPAAYGLFGHGRGAGAVPRGDG